MILFLMSIIAKRTTINSPYYPEIQTPDKSPLEFTFEPGFGLAMIYWPEAIINITDETMSKKISIFDDIHVFTFGRQTDVTISFREDVLFYVFKYPERNSLKLRNLYPICKQYTNTPVIDIDEKTEVYYTAYGKHYIDLTVSFSSGQVTVEYDSDNGHKTNIFQKTFNFKPDFALENLKITSTAQASIGSLTFNCTKKFESQNSRFVDVEVYQTTRDMSRGYIDFKDNTDNSILISDINPKKLCTLRINTTEVEKDGFEISYKYSPDDNEFIKLNSIFYIESTKKIYVYLYATSLTTKYPNCKNSPINEVYYTSTYQYEYRITQNSLPNMCTPPIAKITIYQNISELDFTLYYQIDNSYNNVNHNEEKIIYYSDFNISLLAYRMDLCKRSLIKTLEIKVGESIIVNITNEDIPRACLKSDKNYICFSYESDYQKCLDAVEGRVIQQQYTFLPYRLYDPGENCTILLFRNMTGDSAIFMNQYDVIFGPDCFLDLYNVNQISGSQETKLIIDNLTFDPSNIDKLIITSSKHIKVKPSTGQPVSQITIETENELILEALDDKADSSKYPNIIINKYGLINLYDYPIEKVSTNRTIVNGAYVICNYESENSNCPRDFYEKFKVHNVTLSAVEMKIKSYVYIFLDTFDHNIDIDINKFNNQLIIFIENKNSNHLLEEKPKIRFTSAKNIIFDDDNLIFSNGTHNKLSMYFYYNNLFTVACEDYLTISQHGYQGFPINIEPINDNSIIYYDSSVSYPQAITLNVDMKNIKKVNFYIDSDDHSTYWIYDNIKCGEQRCNEDNLDYKYGIPPGLDTGNGDAAGSDNEPNDDKDKDGDNKNGLSGGAIAGIVIAVIVVIAAVIVAVIFFMKKKNNQNASSNENDDNQENKDL